EVPGGGGRGVTGVVPPLERGDHHGIDELGTGAPPDVLHDLHATYGGGMRRPVAVAGFTLLALVVGAAPAGAVAQDDRGDRRDLPATHLEAEARDDGTEDAATWLLGSGVAAVLLVGAGGTWMARRQRRADPDGPP